MITKRTNHLIFQSILGARKWQVSLDFDEEAFQSAIYKIYPRLTSVSSYTLWNIKKDKTFEKLPAKVRVFFLQFLYQDIKYFLRFKRDLSDIYLLKLFIGKHTKSH